MMIIGVFLCGLTGVVIAVWSLFSSCLELHSLTLLRLNGPKKLAGLSNIIRDSFKVAAQAIVMGVGVFASVTARDYSDEVMLAIAAISVLLTCSLVVDRIRRIKVEMMYDHEMALRPTFSHKRVTDAAEGP
jgi:hypothetical protein